MSTFQTWDHNRLQQSYLVNIDYTWIHTKALLMSFKNWLFNYITYGILCSRIGFDTPGPKTSRKLTHHATDHTRSFSPLFSLHFGCWTSKFTNKYQTYIFRTSKQCFNTLSSLVKDTWGPFLKVFHLCVGLQNSPRIESTTSKLQTHWVMSSDTSELYFLEHLSLWV